MDNTPVLIFKNRACSLGALITLVWLERPFYVTEMTEENGDDPNFLTLNALGEVPTLFLDGTVLTENVAVLTHLALQDLSKNLIFKTGTHDFDQFMRALAFLATEFHKSFAPLHLAEKLTEDKKAQQDIKKNTIQVAIKEVYAYTNEHLLRTTFMYDHPMAIDAYLFAIARWGDKLFDIEKEFPHVKRFQDAMAKDPGVKLALEIESGKQKIAKGAFLGNKDFKEFVKQAAARKLEVDAKRGDGEFTPGLNSEQKATATSEQKKYA